MNVRAGHVRALRIGMVANTSWYLYNFRLNLARALMADGHRVVAIGGDGEYAEHLQAAGVAHRAVAFSLSGTHPGRELGTIAALRRVFAAEELDLVLSYTPKGNIYSALALAGRRGELLVNVSGLGTAFARTDMLAAVVRGLYRIALRRSAWVFFQNDDDREAFVARGLVDARKSSRIPGSGVDLSAFDPSAYPSEPAPADPLFLMVARLLWDKGVGDFIQAARRVKSTNPNVRFRLLGSLVPGHSGAVPESELIDWVRSGIVEYAGSVHDVRLELARATCVVLPSVYREGVPRALLEAAAMTRPVITTDGIGCRDTVDEEVTGFLCRPRDSADLARQMLRMLALSPGDRRRMGAAARLKMEREFSETRVIQAYLDRIERIAGTCAETPDSR